MGNLSIILVLAFILAFGYVGYRQRSVQENVMATEAGPYLRANVKLAALSGANIALDSLSFNNSFRTTITGLLNNDSFRVEVLDRTVDTTLPLGAVRLRSTAWHVQRSGTQYIWNIRDTVLIGMSFMNFAQFAYASNSEGHPSGTPKYFQTGDTFRGPAYTNDYWSFSGTPVFLSSCGSAQVYAPTGTYQSFGVTNPSFAETPIFGGTPISLPLDIEAQRAAGQSASGRAFNHPDVWIQFNANGTFSWRYNNPGPPWTPEARPSNGTIYVGPNNGNSHNYDMHIAGTVKGSWTVVTMGIMHIYGDIVYNTDPRTTPSSTDMLGIVSATDCAVDNNVTNGNRLIMAHITTMNTADNDLTNFYCPTYATGVYGVLTLYGGLIQQRRGALGVVGPPRYGYNRYYIFDTRLTNNAPPNYPSSSSFNKLTYWE